MTLKFDMTSNDVDRQIELLKYYPEILEKYFRPALNTSVKLLEGNIKPNIPRRTGRALAAFKARVTGKGVNLQGQVGWWGKTAAWYINVVEHGAAPHEINSYAPGAGVYIKKHPGFPARGFMAAGFAAARPVIYMDMARASVNVVNELAVK